MTYNLTHIGNSTGFLQFMQRVNTELMKNQFGTVILIVIAMICFIAFAQTTNEPKKAIPPTMFIAFALSILLRAMSLVPDKVIFITLIGAAISVPFARK